MYRYGTVPLKILKKSLTCRDFSERRINGKTKIWSFLNPKVAIAEEESTGNLKRVQIETVPSIILDFYRVITDQNIYFFIWD